MREIRVVEDGVVLRTIPLIVPRPDVVALYPGAPRHTGFWSLVGTLGTQLDFTLVLRAVLDDGTEIDLGSIRGRRAPIAASTRTRLRPLLLTSLARTGTTLLMGHLSSHPAIVADRAYPYEVFAARYWLHMLRVLSEPANHNDSSHPGDFSGELWTIGSNPFHVAPLTSDPALADLLGRTYVERLARFCQESIDEFYTAVAVSQGKASAEFFVEKFHPDHVPRVARDLYPDAKEIFLVRDFRDLICSVFAFNEKRRTLEFGRDRVATDEDYVEFLAVSADRLVNEWKSRSATSHLVRYEDLVRRPEATIEGVLEYLEVDRNPEIIQAMVRQAFAHPEADAHRTTGTALESIGRWRHDLPRRLRSAVRESLHQPLVELGYELC